DMQYTKAQGAKFDGRNSKGLLHINPDKTVSHRKAAYFAAQHIFSTFDNRFPLRELQNLAETHDVRTSAFAWTRNGDAHPALIAWWRTDAAPALKDPAMDHLALPPVA